MAFDEALASRVRTKLVGKGDIAERKAFGGVMFLLGGKMCLGVHENRLMVRASPDRYEALLKRPGAGPMDFTGRPMRGFLFVGPAGVRDARALRFWVDEAVSYVRTVPARKGRTRRGKGRASAKKRRDGAGRP